MPYLGTFMPEFEKTIVIFEISTFEFVKIQSFKLKKNKLNLKPKLSYMGILDWNLKKLLLYLKSAPSNLSYCKASYKKKLWVLDQNLLGYNLKKLLSYLKSAHSNMSKCKVSCWMKKFQVWNQNCLIWVFLDWNLKKFLLYLKLAPSSLLKMNF